MTLDRYFKKKTVVIGSFLDNSPHIKMLNSSTKLCVIINITL